MSTPKRSLSTANPQEDFWRLATAITSDSPSTEELSSVPNLVALISPALNIEQSERFRKLAGTRTDFASISVLQNARKGMPPMMILTGEGDALSRARR